MDWCLIAAWTISLSTLGTIAKVVIGIGLVIFVHELGHFLAAKLCGVKVERFYVGFDLPDWSLFGLRVPGRFCRFQWGETEYGIGIIPLGGYVKMLGQDDNPTRAEEEAARIRIPAATADGQVAATLDPRSYPAKSVLERMLIISAGILMNLLFAVIFAAVAYRLGIWYLPCDLGAVLPGDPAWAAGWQPGDKVLQVGLRGAPDEHLRFDKDLRYRVFVAGFSGDGVEPLDVLVRHKDGTEKWYRVVPRMRGIERKVATLGITALQSTTLHAEKPAVAYLAAGKAEPALQPGDRIVAIDGIRLDRTNSNARGDIPAHELLSYLARHRGETVTLAIERQQGDGPPQELSIRVPPQPLRGVGIVMEIGPIVAVQLDSPAAQAGIQLGDVIRAINGQPVGDPLTIAERFESTSDPVVLTVERRSSGKEEAERLDVTLVPRAERTTIPLYTEGGRIAIDRWGLAYEVTNRVLEVHDEQATAAGLVPGSRIIAVRPLATEPEAHQLAQTWLSKNYDTQINLDENLNWVYVHGVLQDLPPGFALQVLAEAPNGRTLECRLPIREIPGLYAVDRGLVFRSMEQLRRAESWAEAVALGWRETGERLGEVATVLGLLVRGRMGMDNLAGPVRIAAFAGQEAAKGWPALLMFLTMLSANLALLNALPIPVLDGGHFMFLLVEGITRRPVPEKWQGALSLIGLVCLLALIVYVSTNDVRWLFRWF